MGSSALWIIILGVWVFALQNRIKDLENMVEDLLDKHKRKVPTPEKEQLKEASSEVYVEKVDVVEKIEVPKEKEYQSAVSQLKASNPSPKATTRVLKKKQEPEPTEPSWLMQMLSNYFTGGNLLVRIGGVILFFGLAFLVKYAAEHTTISMEFRLGFVALVAVGFIVLGWRLREREGAYGQILQGLGVATLYLVIYGASKFYTLLSLESAFVLMLIVVVLGSFLALKQSSLPLALFATTGGFLVPILTSTGEGSHVTLFSYYFVLNLGIFFMAWKQTWRVLNIVGFLFTFVIATSWGVLRYSPELFSSTEPFLILYFLMYLTITILFAGKSKGHLVDGTLLFGLPAVVLPLQVQLVSHLEYGAGYSAIAMGSLYLILAKVLKGKTPSTLLLQSFFGLGILFFTTAIPYFFDADITAAIWAMESSAVIWLALKQKRVFVRYFGELLLFVSVGLYLVSQIDNAMNISIYLSYTIVTLATFFAAYQLEKNKEYLQIDRYLPIVFLVLSFAIWMLSVVEVAVWVDAYMLMHKILLGFTLGTMFIALADKMSTWQLLGRVLQVTLPVGVVLFMLSLTTTPHPINPFDGLGAVAFFALMFWHTMMLYRYDKLWEFTKYLHIMSLWFGVGVLTLALCYVAITGEASSTMILLATGILPLLSAFALMRVNLTKLGLASYAPAYKHIGVAGLLVFLLFWQGIALFFRADTLALAYVPVFNLLDMAQLAVLYTMYTWVRHHKQENIWGLPLYFMSVVLATTVFARAMAHYGNHPYSMEALSHVFYFQVGAVLLWSAIIWVSVKAFKRYGVSALKTGSAFLLLPLLLWELRAFSYAPDFLQSYFPLVNLLDIAQIVILGISGYWLYAFRKNFDKTIKDIFSMVLGVLALILLSVIFARAVHMYQEVPYMLSTLWSNLYFQTGLSLLWSAVAIVLMLLSKRYSHRVLWLAGFGLLGLVVLKLFFVELANSGTIERIISFMVVGTLLLLIGYFVPMPPSREKERGDDEKVVSKTDKTQESTPNP